MEKQDQEDITRNTQLMKEREMQDVRGDTLRDYTLFAKRSSCVILFIGTKQKEKTTAILQGSDRGKEAIRTEYKAR